VHLCMCVCVCALGATVGLTLVHLCMYVCVCALGGLLGSPLCICVCVCVCALGATVGLTLVHLLTEGSPTVVPNAHTYTHTQTHTQTYTHTQTNTHTKLHPHQKTRSIYHTCPFSRCVQVPAEQAGHTHTHTYTHMNIHTHAHAHLHCLVIHRAQLLCEMENLVKYVRQHMRRFLPDLLALVSMGLQLHFPSEKPFTENSRHLSLRYSCIR